MRKYLDGYDALSTAGGTLSNSPLVWSLEYEYYYCLILDGCLSSYLIDGDDHHHDVHDVHDYDHDDDDVSYI